MMGIDYYEKAVAKNGAETTDFFRLFMVPGMFHCRGGVGTGAARRADGADQLGRERHRARHHHRNARWRDGKPVRTRPLCPYPQVARYTGNGSHDDAANFACKAAD